MKAKKYKTGNMTESKAGNMSENKNRNKNRNKDRSSEWNTRGSLTVEAAVVLPLFFMAALTLILFMDALKIQTKKNLELSGKARTLAAAAGCVSQGGGTAGESGTSSGSSGSGSGNGQWIDLASSEKMRMPFPVFGLKDIRILCRARVYPWIGSDDGLKDVSGNGTGEKQSKTAYISENEEVLHTHADCTHLNLTIIRTTVSGASAMRNADGKKYKKCRGFPSNYTGPVYLTPNGRYYYPSDQYGSLTRHVRIVNKEEYSRMKICERCAARDRAG